MKVHHIGYLIKNIEKAKVKFEVLGFSSLSDIVYDEYRKINVLFMQNGNEIIELVSPADSESVVYNLLKRYKNAPYHLCFYTDDLGRDTTIMKENGFVQIDDSCPAPAINNCLAAFFINASVGIVELVEVK